MSTSFILSIHLHDEIICLDWYICAYLGRFVNVDAKRYSCGSLITHKCQYKPSVMGQKYDPICHLYYHSDNILLDVEGIISREVWYGC